MVTYAGTTKVCIDPVNIHFGTSVREHILELTLDILDYRILGNFVERVQRPRDFGDE